MAQHDGARRSGVLVTTLALLSIACVALFAWAPQAFEQGYAALRDRAYGVARRLLGAADQPPLAIACAAPLTGPAAFLGNDICEGAETLVREVNAAGGVQGRPLLVRRYDDQDERDRATKVAEEISRSSDAVAVIGHGSSTASNAAAY
jgi:ABC-type branched-subunit amino acid transport system substrate-binding protein